MKKMISHKFADDWKSDQQKMQAILMFLGIGWRRWLRLKEWQFRHFCAFAFHSDGAFETGRALRRFALRQFIPDMLDAIRKLAGFDAFAVESKPPFGNRGKYGE